MKDNKHWLWLLYFVFYFPAFFLLERYGRAGYIINFPPDRLIPFCEWFIFPYAAWYITMPGSLLILGALDKEAFLKLCFMMFGGMTIALIVYVIAPNGLDLRVAIERDNIAAAMCRILQSADTPTNVCPSIHVSSSAAIDVAVRKSRVFRDNKTVCAVSFAVCVLVCISTVFLKQHSIVDVIAGAALNGILYIAAYHTPLKRIFMRDEGNSTVKAQGKVHG